MIEKRAATFYVWLKKYPAIPAAPRFVEVALPQTDSPAAAPFHVEFPNGIRLLIAPGFNAAEVNQLLQLLSHP